jgi:hypothetical protein
MEHVAASLRRLAESRGIELHVSPQKARRLEAIELIRTTSDQSRPELAFGARPFVLCGLPIRRPRDGTLKHIRQNGKFRLEILGHPDYGLPFGQDRLIPIWVATLAVRQKSRMVLFRSAAEILEEFDLPKDGPHYRRLVDGFKRIFTSSVYFGTDGAAYGQQVWDYRRFHFFDRLRIWCSRTADEDIEDIKPDCNIICLSEAFWQEIQGHPIPVDVRIIRALTSNAGCLDLYVWLSWRCFHAKRTEQVPLFGPRGLANQLGVIEYTRDRNFRKRLREWLGMVHLYWPDCPARLTDDGTALTVAPSSSVRSAGSFLA